MVVLNHITPFMGKWLTEIKILPTRGKLLPAPYSAFAYADPKCLSKPITSPVDFISGDKKIFWPGNL